ncbi:MAG: helix-turn-helix domain-containing protein [Actinomycetota bacterium]
MKLTVPEAARRTGRNPETIRRWIRSGKLPSEKVGTQQLVDEDDLARVALGGRARPSQEVREQGLRWLDALQELRRDHPRPDTGPSLTELVHRTRQGREGPLL